MPQALPEQPSRKDAVHASEYDQTLVANHGPGCGALETLVHGPDMHGRVEAAAQLCSGNDLLCAEVFRADGVVIAQGQPGHPHRRQLQGDLAADSADTDNHRVTPCQVIGWDQVALATG
jgi:hypothetical protein